MASADAPPALSRWARCRQALGKPPLRQVLMLLAVLAACYVGIVVLMLMKEDQFLYHPTRDSDWRKPPRSLRTEDVWLTLADGQRIHAWWCPHDGPDGAILYAHPAGGNLSYYGPEAARLQQELGLSLLLFDYPGYGKSDGQPSEAGCYAAADAAYDWLAQRVPAERIVLYGYSLGGAVATDLAVRKPHQALVLCRTFTSIPDIAQNTYPYLPARFLVRNRFDSGSRIGRCLRPVFIAQADQDSIIPFEQGQRLYAAAPEPKQFFVLAGCNHGTPLPPEYYAALGKFLHADK